MLVETDSSRCEGKVEFRHRLAIDSSDDDRSDDCLDLRVYCGGFRSSGLASTSPTLLENIPLIAGGVFHAGGLMKLRSHRKIIVHMRSRTNNISLSSLPGAKFIFRSTVSGNNARKPSMFIRRQPRLYVFPAKAIAIDGLEEDRYRSEICSIKEYRRSVLFMPCLDSGWAQTTIHAGFITRVV